MADVFNNAINRNISMVKGDTLSFGFQIQGLENQEPDAVYFSCKASLEDETYIFQKTLSGGIVMRSYDTENDIYTYGVRVAPSDTSDEECGRYFYDLSIHVNGDVLTLMRGMLEIVWEAENE